MSDWFRENRWLGTFLVVVGVCAIAALVFLFSAKGRADDAAAQFSSAASERSRLEQLDPFPSEANYRKMKTHLDNYAASLEKLKEELKTHVIAAGPLAPNEFQTRLRQAMLAAAEKARANRVKLPENFALGFEEFTTALPNTADAPVLGQELAQAELLANVLIEGRVDGITGFKRVITTPAAAAAGAPGAVNPVAGPGRKPPATATTKTIERGVIDLSFTAAPSVVRRVLNQIATSPQQFYIVRTLHVRNEKDKGPPREQPGTAPAATAASTPAAPVAPAAPGKPGSNAALTFIVGNEHLETSARVEMVRFTY